MRNVMSKGVFFSSRRRHTRWPRDWSSDVCSSDLKNNKGQNRSKIDIFYSLFNDMAEAYEKSAEKDRKENFHRMVKRSEERRVGKECGYKRGAWWRKDETRERLVEYSKDRTEGVED